MLKDSAPALVPSADAGADEALRCRILSHRVWLIDLRPADAHMWQGEPQCSDNLSALRSWDLPPTTWPM